MKNVTVIAHISMTNETVQQSLFNEVMNRGKIEQIYI